MTGLQTLDPLLAVAAAGFIALILARAAAHKMSEFVAFTGTLSDYRMLPERLLAPAAMLLIGVETAIAAGLLWSGTRPFAGIAAAALLLLYAAVMAVPLSQGRTEISCGCGGPTDHLSPALLVRNGVLAALALVAAAPVSDRALSWLDVLSLPFAVVGMWFILETAEQALQNEAYIRALKSRLRSEV
jgi:hypothetical protein